MFETSASTEKLDDALAKVQGEIEAASKDKTNPHFKSRYADLSSMWEACRPALARHQVSVTQWPVHSEDGRLHIVTRIAHKGEWMKATFSMPVPKQDPQGMGSATTYAKRYTLSAALGIVADEDDDGNAASRPAARPPVQNFAPKPHAVVDELDQALGAATADYMIQATQLKGKRLGEVSKADIQKLIGWVDEQRSRNADFKPHPKVTEFYDKATEYLMELSNR